MLWPIKMKRLIVALIFALCLKPVVCVAAFEVNQWGAYSAAMGGAFSAHVGATEGSLLNPAVAASIRVKSFSSTYVQLFSGVPGGLKQSSGGGVVPTLHGGAIVNYARFGDGAYSEQTLGIGFARQFHERVSIGFRLGNEGWEFRNLGRRDWSLDVGGLYEVGWITAHTFARLGLVAKGLGSTTKDSGKLTGHRPSRYVVALELRPDQQVFATEIETDREYWEVRLGCETRLIDDLMLRVGGNMFFDDSVNRTANIGLGYTWNSIRIDYAYSNSYDVSSFGATHRIGIGLFGS